MAQSSSPRSNAKAGVKNSPATAQMWVFEDSVKESVSNHYEITEKLGMGAFGVVKKGVDKKTGQEVAIKSIKKTDCKPEELRSEVAMLRQAGNYPGSCYLFFFERSNLPEVSLLCKTFTKGKTA